jgi:hypothetical protein
VSVSPAKEQPVQPSVCRFRGQLPKPRRSFQGQGSGSFGLVAGVIECGVGNLGAHPQPEKLGPDGPAARQAQGGSIANELPSEPIVVDQPDSLEVLEGFLHFGRFERRLGQPSAKLFATP